MQCYKCQAFLDLLLILVIVEMGKKGFDRKKAVRFVLAPGPEKDGKPTVLFKPVETKRSKVSKKQRKHVISQISDYDQITINGKVMEEDQIPAYVLEQIRGRTDLVYNQKHEMPKEEQADMYQLQDGKDEEQYEEYSDYDEEEAIQQKQEEYSDQDQQWVDQQEQEVEQHIKRQAKVEVKKQTEKFEAKVQQFPTIESTETVNFEGKDYQLTQKQIQMLETVIPANYQQMDFGGLQFKKYNEDGLLISEKQKYQKYLIGQDQKIAVVDTYEYVPSKPVDFFDNDLKPSEINADTNIKQVEQSLNYAGQEQIYDQLEDDFFVNMIKMQLKQTQSIPAKQQTIKVGKQQIQQKNVKKIKKVKQTVVAQQPQLNEKQIDEQLKKAVYNFQNNIQENKQKKGVESSSEQEEEQSKSHQNHSMNFTDIQKRQEYIGRDGQLDWRCLSKKQKKQYMKTKVIRDFYDQLRQRQIQEKMAGKSNVNVQQLHLKTLIRHIPYDQDHVMQKTLQQDLKKEVNLNKQQEEDYQSLSDEDDIVSFHQKSSIIASNLSVIEEPHKKPKKQKKQQEKEQMKPILKVVPQRRNKDQTSQERKQRKNKLRDMKKDKKLQKKQFEQKFDKIKREHFKKQNPNNPLSKISYVKIY